MHGSEMRAIVICNQITIDGLVRRVGAMRPAQDGNAVMLRQKSKTRRDVPAGRKSSVSISSID
jgi:hypothetical protein